MPRPETTLPELLKLSADSGVDRIPVISKKGSALGLINVFEVLLDPRPRRSLRDYTRRLVIAMENESAYRIIRRLRAARLTLAGVVDAERKLTGIVTVEDLVRRLVQNA